MMFIFYLFFFCFPNPIVFLRMNAAFLSFFSPSVIHSAHTENHILLFNTCRGGSQVQMDQQGGITGKPTVPWFYPDANRPRIQSSVTTVLLQSLQGWFHPTSCLLRGRKLLLSGILHQVRANPGLWPRRTMQFWAPEQSRLWQDFKWCFLQLQLFTAQCRTLGTTGDLSRC